MNKAKEQNEKKQFFLRIYFTLTIQYALAIVIFYLLLKTVEIERNPINFFTKNLTVQGKHNKNFTSTIDGQRSLRFTKISYRFAHNFCRRPEARSIQVTQEEIADALDLPNGSVYGDLLRQFGECLAKGIKVDRSTTNLNGCFCQLVPNCGITILMIVVTLVVIESTITISQGSKFDTMPTSCFELVRSLLVIYILSTGIFIGIALLHSELYQYYLNPYDTISKVDVWLPGVFREIQYYKYPWVYWMATTFTCLKMLFGMWTMRKIDMFIQSRWKSQESMKTDNSYVCPSDVKPVALLPCTTGS